MKTYLLDIKEQLLNWSDSLDATAVLCKKGWLVYNDEGIKELFVFRKDGSLIISVNGNITYAQWEYLAVTQSVIITNSNGQSYMMNPVIYDDKVITLQKDGTQEYTFLIDQQEVEKLLFNNLQTLLFYVNNHDEYIKLIEEKHLAEEEQKRKVEEERLAKIRNIQKREEEQRKEWEMFINKKIDEWIQSEEIQKRCLIAKVIGIFTICIIAITILVILCNLKNLENLSSFFVISAILSFFGLYAFFIINPDVNFKEQKLKNEFTLKEYINKHSDNK